MRLGCRLADARTAGRPDALRAQRPARRGARLSLRLGGRPAPRARRAALAVSGDAPTASLPEYFKRSMDPVEALTFVAAHTRRITLGTSVLNMPFYNPVVLARRLATLDVLSGGRLRVGLGQAWSVDELEAVGADPKARGARADEFIRGPQDACGGRIPSSSRAGTSAWRARSSGSSPSRRRIRRSTSRPTCRRRSAARPALADGWLPSAPCRSRRSAQMVIQLRTLAREAGRDPARLEVIYLTGAQVTNAALDDAKRGLLCGQRRPDPGDVGRLRDAGVTEVIAWSGGDDARRVPRGPRALPRGRRLTGDTGDERSAASDPLRRLHRRRPDDVARSPGGLAARGRDGLRHGVGARPLLRRLRRPGGAVLRGRHRAGGGGRLHAAHRGRAPRAQQHVPAPGGPGQHRREPRSRRGGALHARARRGVASDGARRLRPPVRHDAGPHRAARRGAHGDPPAPHRAPRELRGPLLPPGRCAVRAQAVRGPAAACPHRRGRGAAHAPGRRQARRRVERRGRAHAPSPGSSGCSASTAARSAATRTTSACPSCCGARRRPRRCGRRWSA